MIVSDSAAFLTQDRIRVAADYYRCYPGETVRLFTRVAVERTWESAGLQVTLPPGLVYEISYLSGPTRNKVPQIAVDQGTTYVLWDLTVDTDEAPVFECQVDAKVAPLITDCSFACRSLLTANLPDGQSTSQEDTVTILGRARGDYLKYLPAIYQEDEFMGRFLMLFESFLKPLEGQIESQDSYLDPRIAPPEFLPWLASWSGLALDEQLPEERRRVLLKEMPVLYKKRGTRWGLQRHLEIFTGGTVQITEHYSRNFALGERAFLGPGVALGVKNVPNTFSVAIQLPPAEAPSGEEDQQAMKILEQKIIAIIEAAKPVHTGYELQIT